MAIIIGIDPGLQKTGWGVISTEGHHIRFLGCGTIRTDAKDTLHQRLHDLHNGVREVMTQASPDACAMEETFLNKNPLSSAKLWQARGALILASSLAQIPFYEYAATLVKKSVVGVGRADKTQVTMMIKQLLPTAQIDSEDAADALAVAICHHHHASFNTLLGANA